MQGVDLTLILRHDGVHPPGKLHSREESMSNQYAAYCSKRSTALSRLNYESGWGLYLHPRLVVTPESFALRLLAASSGARGPGSLGQESDPHRPLEDKESARWVGGFAHVKGQAIERLSWYLCFRGAYRRHAVAIAIAIAIASRSLAAVILKRTFRRNDTY